MRLIKITLLAAGALLYTSCKKSDVSSQSSTPANTDDCVVQKSARDGAVIEGRYIVAYQPNVISSRSTQQSRTALNNNVLADHNISASAVEASFAGETTGFVAELSSAEAASLRGDPAVSAVEPDRIVALSTCFTVVAPSLITWNVNKVGYGNGIGKTAWIVDTGIDPNHPDLNVDLTRSKSFLTGNTSVADENGHGSHVAGIIGAKNNDYGVLGIASGASLVSLRVLDKDGSGTLSAIIQALSYVLQNGKAGDVVNLSLGEDEVSDILDQQVQAVAAKGIYVTIAAGNDGKAADLYSPGRANGTNIYTVSATDSLDNFASFSNFGNDAVDYAEPGVRILSTYKDGLYARMSGTSMAAPHLAGLLLINNGVIHSSLTAKNDPDGTPDKIGQK